MNELMQNLFELQTLEFEETIQPNAEEAIARLRAKIPKPILGHYDRLGDRGKKGVALLNQHTCSACHMNVPIGLILDLKRGKDVCLCGNCGRYLHLPDEKVPADCDPVIRRTVTPGKRHPPVHASLVTGRK